MAGRPAAEPAPLLGLRGVWRVLLSLFVAVSLIAGARIRANGEPTGDDRLLVVGGAAMITVAVFQAWLHARRKARRANARRMLVAAFLEGPPAPPARAKTHEP